MFTLEKLSKKISPWFFLLLVFATSQTVFSGHPQTALYIILLSFLYASFKFVTERNTKFMVLSILAVVFGLLLSAPQILPSLEFANQSARNLDQMYTNGRLDWFLPPQNLIQMFAPDYFGNPATNNYWGVWNYTEFVSFIGVVPLAMVALAFFKRERMSNFFVSLIFLSLFLALQNPISKVPYIFNLPFISTLQPSRIIFLLDFSLCVLAAFGLQYFLNSKNKKPIVLTITFLLLICAIIVGLTHFGITLQTTSVGLDPKAIASRNLIFPFAFVAAFITIGLLKVFNFKKSILLLLIFVLSVIELYRFAYKFTPFTKISSVYPETQITQYLKNAPRPFRIVTTDRRLMHPNISSVYGIETIDGYDPLYLKNYADYISKSQSKDPTAPASSFGRIITPQNYQSELIGLLNAQYVLSLDSLESQDLELMMEEGSTKLYKNNKALPRVFFPSEIVKVQSTEDEYNKLLEEGFISSGMATSNTLSVTQDTSSSNISFKNYSDQEFSVITESDKSNYFVTTNIFYPGWEAYVDDARVKIEKTNAIFQMVEVPQGKHTVTFKFEPKSFYNGLYLAFAAFVASLLVAYLIWRKKFQ